MPRTAKIGIIGAGLSALTAAHDLQKNGHQVELLEKSHHPGGRMATRNTGECTFDHGAQYFTARGDAFKREVKSWKRQGFVKEWNGRIGEIRNNTFQQSETPLQRYVGVPSMRAISCQLEKKLCIHYENPVTSAYYRNSEWHLSGRNTEFTCDTLIISTPPQQALTFLPSKAKLTEIVKKVKLEPCWSVMITFPRSLDISFDAAFINKGPISWIARNSSKPKRNDVESWVLHATSEWSLDFFDQSGEVVTEVLLDCFQTIAGQKRITPNFTAAHRWRYSTCKSPLNCGSLWDTHLKIGLCGDWCDSLRVEGAFMSGRNLANKIAETYQSNA
tara:strand:- start:2182 stop:3174 length:993 start_codon:yes stop_codon:yes gene_type:complete